MDVLYSASLRGLEPIVQQVGRMVRWYATALDTPNNMLIELYGESVRFKVDTATCLQETCSNGACMCVPGTVPECMHRVGSRRIKVADQSILKYLYAYFGG